MTMLDFPGRVACTVFTAGCNFRCPFCHNSSLVTKINAADAYAEEDILAYLKKRRGILDGVAITGGEPLLTDGIFDFMRRIRSLGLEIKLDTNGSFPQRLRSVISEGLVSYVAMDIKNSRAKYPLTAGVSTLDLAPIEESVELLLGGAVDYEFRTTVVKELHTPEDMEDIGRWIRGARRYYLQNFVDSGELISDGLHPHSAENMKELQNIASKFVEKAEMRGL